MTFKYIKSRFINEKARLDRTFGVDFYYKDIKQTESIYFTINPSDKNKIKYARISDHAANLKNFMYDYDYNVRRTVSPKSHANISIEFFNKITNDDLKQRVYSNQEFKFEVDTFIYDINLLTDKDISKILNSFEKWATNEAYVAFKDPFENTPKAAKKIKGVSRLFNTDLLNKEQKEEIDVDSKTSVLKVSSPPIELYKEDAQEMKQDNWYLFITYDLSRPVDDQLEDFLDSLEIRNRVLEKLRPKIRKLIREMI